MKRLATGLKLGMAALALGSIFAAAGAAQARDWDDGWRHDAWRRHEWREHEWREHEWREHERWEHRHWAPYGYGYYAAPSYYYGPPAVTYEPPGVSLGLSLR